MALTTINNNNVQGYIDKQLIDPYNIKIDLNTTKTANDNTHRWITLADAIKSKYKFNFDYDIKDNPQIKTLPEVTVVAPLKMYSVGAGEMKPFNSLEEASEYVQAHPKKDASENVLNWILAGTTAGPAATITAGYLGDRLFHDTIQSYNGEDIDKNGMWVYNPGGWVTGYGAFKVPRATKALYMIRNAVRSPLVGVRMRTMKLGSVEQPELISQSRYRVGDIEINDPNLNYRQGSQGMADDFLQSGKVRVKYEGEAAAKREKVPGKFLLTKSFNNPMFKQGGLWYDSWIISEPGATPSQSDLLITRQPLRFATKGSGPAKADLGGRRIPFNEEQLNLSNTSAFRWEDGYGFRRLPQQPIIQFPIFTK